MISARLELLEKAVTLEDAGSRYGVIYEPHGGDFAAYRLDGSSVTYLAVCKTVEAAESWIQRDLADRYEPYADCLRLNHTTGLAETN